MYTFLNPVANTAYEFVINGRKKLFKYYGKTTANGSYIMNLGDHEILMTPARFSFLSRFWKVGEYTVAVRPPKHFENERTYTQSDFDAMIDKIEEVEF